MKLCIDCKHFHVHYPGNYSSRYLQCMHPFAVRIDPVTGDKNLKNCHLMREKDEQCGPEAKLFEQKTNALTMKREIKPSSWWQRWFSGPVGA